MSASPVGTERRFGRPAGAIGVAGRRFAAGGADHARTRRRPAELPACAPAREDELPTQSATAAAVPAEEAFFPAAPARLADTHVAEGEIAGIVLRLLMHRGALTGVEISQQIGLPFPVTEKLLHALKMERLLVFKSAATLSDYVYEITDLGLQRARQSAVHCSYCGAVPVSLDDYCASVAAQSLSRVKPRMESLRRAFADLTISREMFGRLGRAITSGRGLFLHGPPGNGKTSIAERITAAYGTSIWIPRAISVWGEIIRLFDPSCHEELPLATGERIVADEKIDHRWVRIRRPTIVVGGELTMESLEITVHKETGIGKAPLADEEQRRDVGDRRFRPPARAAAETVEPLDRALGRAARLSGTGQRAKDLRALRPVHRLFHEPGAEGPGRRGILAADSLQDRGRESQRRAIPQVIRADLPEARDRLRWGRAGSFDRAGTTTPPPGRCGSVIPATCCTRWESSAVSADCRRR